MIYSRLFGAILTFLASASFANDSTMAFTNNGVVYVPEERISLNRETLLLSREKIKVDYVFENLTNEDVIVKLAFPVATCFRCYDGDVSLPAQSSEDYGQTAFLTLVEGERVSSQMQLRAVKNGADVSAELTTFGIEISDVPFEDTGSQFMEMSNEMRDRLEQAGFLDDGYPNWDVEKVYLWSATFPAGKLTNVSHEYIPSISGQFYGQNLADQFPDSCVESSFEKSAAGPEDKLYGNAMELTYLLGPGRNWAGPIGELHVIVDKGDPKSLVSFCADGVKKTAPTRFEFTRINYEPEQDEVMSVLFVERFNN